jgi:hypothetical protein
VGNKSTPPTAPDYSGLISAANKAGRGATGNSNQQEAWARSQYGADQGYSNQVGAIDLQSAKEQQANAEADRARFDSTTVPLEQQQVQQAKDYNNPAFRDQQMGAAGAGVAQGFETARDNATRDLESYGVDPSSTRFGALDTNVRTQQAAAQVGAERQAGLQTDATARALTDQAIRTGQIDQGMVGGEYGGSVQGGASGNAGRLATTQSGANTMGTGQSWAGQANTDLNTAGNLTNQQFGNQQTTYQDQVNESNALGKGVAVAGGALVGGALGGPAGALAGGTAMSKMAAGGVVPAIGHYSAGGEATPGGRVPNSASPTRGAGTDDVDAKLTAGEFVMPKDVTSWFGEKHMHGMIKKAREDKAGVTAKPAIGHVMPPQRPTFQSRPAQQVGAI